VFRGELLTYPTGKLEYSPSGPMQGKIILESIKFHKVDRACGTNFRREVAKCDESGILFGELGLQGLVAPNGDYKLTVQHPIEIDKISISYDYEYFLPEDSKRGKIMNDDEHKELQEAYESPIPKS
jgi:hypothetical protein